MRILGSLLLLLALSSCGGPDPDQLTQAGRNQLAAGDFAAAAESFDQALAALSDKNDKNYLNARMGRIEAWCEIDPGKARDDFLALAAESGKVTDRHFNQVGGRLGSAGNLTEAIAVLEVGKKSFPDSPHLEKLVELLGKKAEAGDPAALEALKGLGYVGD